jgi:hypothetical protein
VVVDVRKDPLGVETDDRETTIDRNCHAAGVSLLLQTGFALSHPFRVFVLVRSLEKKLFACLTCSFCGSGNSIMCLHNLLPNLARELLCGFIFILSFLLCSI